MPVLDDVEQKRSLFGIERHEEEVVEYQQGAALDSFHLGLECAFGLGYFEHSHELGCVGVVGADSFLAGFVPRADARKLLPVPEEPVMKRLRA